jgi:hypothetical protein
MTNPLDDTSLESRFIRGTDRIFDRFGVPAVRVKVTGGQKDPANPRRLTPATKQEDAIIVIKSETEVTDINGTKHTVITVEARESLEVGDYLKINQAIYRVISASPSEIRSTILTYKAIVQGGQSI